MPVMSVPSACCAWAVLSYVDLSHLPFLSQPACHVMSCCAVLCSAAACDTAQGFSCLQCKPLEELAAIAARSAAKSASAKTANGTTTSASASMAAAAGASASRGPPRPSPPPMGHRRRHLLQGSSSCPVGFYSASSGGSDPDSKPSTSGMPPKPPTGAGAAAAPPGCMACPEGSTTAGPGAMGAEECTGGWVGGWVVCLCCLLCAVLTMRFSMASSCECGSCKPGGTEQSRQHTVSHSGNDMYVYLCDAQQLVSEAGVTALASCTWAAQITHLLPACLPALSRYFVLVVFLPRAVACWLLTTQCVRLVGAAQPAWRGYERAAAAAAAAKLCLYHRVCRCPNSGCVVTTQQQHGTHHTVACCQ